jgi:phasin family protein
MANTRGSTPKSAARSAPAAARGAKTGTKPRAAVATTAAGPIDAKPNAAAPAPQFHAKDETMNAETVMKTVEQATGTVEKVAKDAMAQSQASLDQINVKAGEMVEHATKSVGEMTEFTKGNMEAMMASAKAATTGAEVLAKEMAEHAKARFEATSNAWKAMVAAKTPNELFQYQNDFMKAQVDASIASMSQMTEMMLKFAGEVTQPLSNRMALAAEQVKKTLEQR